MQTVRPIRPSSLARPFAALPSCWLGRRSRRKARSSGAAMVETDRKAHWEAAYATKGEAGVSWYQAEPRLSLELIKEVAPAVGGRIIDVGGGASVLVDRL